MKNAYEHLLSLSVLLMDGSDLVDGDPEDYVDGLDAIRARDTEILQRTAAMLRESVSDPLVPDRVASVVQGLAKKVEAGEFLGIVEDE